MKKIRYGKRKRFEILPSVAIRWYVGIDCRRHFDICFSWLVFYVTTNNEGINAYKNYTMMQERLKQKANAL